MKALQDHIQTDNDFHIDMEKRLTRLETLLYINMALGLLGPYAAKLFKIIGG